MTLNINQFVQKAKLIHGNKYDYSITEYKGYEYPISFICPIHGICTHLAKTHLMGRGCFKCGNGMLSKVDFVKQAVKIHNNRYDYSKTQYKDKQTKITITCKLHGDFIQKPSKHLSGQGCPYCNRSSICGSGKMSAEHFLLLAKSTHKDRYDYSQTKFVNWKTKIKIICKKHGEFFQDPSTHAHRKAGCPHCGFNTSLAANEWLDSFQNANILREKVMMISGRRFKVDGYDPSTQTIYEYFGSYWHGHPNRFDSKELHPVKKITYGQLYQETLNKIQYIQNNGYNIICQWGR